MLYNDYESFAAKAMVQSLYVNVAIVKNFLPLKQDEKKKVEAKVDKRSVQKYLKQQNNEESVNNAPAEALKGLKLD